MNGKPKIAIIRYGSDANSPAWTPQSDDHFLDHYLGALTYLRDHPAWDVIGRGLPLAPIQRLPANEELRRGEIAGVIVEGAGMPAIDRCRDEGIPVVAMDRYQESPAVPTVYSDDVAIGRMAARYFLRRGFQSLGFNCGANAHLERPLLGVTRRMQGFMKTVQAAGAACSGLSIAEPAKARELNPKELEIYFRDLRKWLLDLPRPVGILAASDIWAMDCLEVCRQEGLRVPQDVAVLGVDNGVFRCEASRPSLSSVDRNRHRIGYEAAALLVRYLETGRWDEVPVMVPPAGVEERLSTDTLAVADAKVAKALRFVREHFCDPISTHDVARGVGVSESWLAHAFQRELGFSIVSEIRRLRVAKACGLLAANELPLKTVAEIVGLRSPAYLCHVFAKEMGVSPRAWKLSQHGNGARARA